MGLTAAPLTGPTVGRATRAVLLRIADAVATCVTRSTVFGTRVAGLAGVTGTISADKGAGVAELTIFDREEDTQLIPGSITAGAVEGAYAGADVGVCTTRGPVRLTAATLGAGAATVFGACAAVLIAGAV